MKPFFQVLHIRIPSYGLMIVIGLLIANLIGYRIMKRFHLDFNDFIIMESFSFMGGIFGAKLLFFLVSFRAVEWNRLGELPYLLALFRSGFVFYGGLIGGVIGVLLAGHLFKLPTSSFIRHGIALVPLVHGFGRIGCFLAGCCYGIPYSGFGAVRFPKGSFAPPGIQLFPVQTLESLLLILIALLIIGLDLFMDFLYTAELYLFLYAAIRFVLEYFRYDAERGFFLIFSTSQWISLLLAIFAFFIYNSRRKKLENKMEWRIK